MLIWEVQLLFCCYYSVLLLISQAFYIVFTSPEVDLSRTTYILPLCLLYASLKSFLAVENMLTTTDLFP